MDIQTRRKQAGLTQKALAKKLEVDQASISNWERGKCIPQKKYIRKLAKLLKCTEAELMKEEAATKAAAEKSAPQESA